MTVRRVFLIFDSDSQYFACKSLVPQFLRSGWVVEFVILGDFKTPDTNELSGVSVTRVETVDDVWAVPNLGACDAIGAYLPGSRLRIIWNQACAYYESHGRRPLLFTGYNGVVLERFEDGISWRSGFDIIALNSPEDLEKANAFAGHSTIQRPTLMPIVGINRNEKALDPKLGFVSNWENLRQVVFAEQVLFPRGVREKFYLYSQLIRIALENPDWEVIVKPRTLPGGTTFHRQTDHISEFISRHFALPSNMRIRYEPLDKILKETTVLFSISSTAFFDAVSMGVPSYVLSDFGISTNYGTHYFHGCGCTICLADIGQLSHDLFRATPSNAWLEFKGFSSQFTPANIVQELNRLIDAGKNCAPLIPVETEQRLTAEPADIPEEYLVRQSLWTRLTESPNHRIARRPPPTFRKALARLKRKGMRMILREGAAARDENHPSG